MNNITNAFRGLAALLLAALFTVNCAWADVTETIDGTNITLTGSGDYTPSIEDLSSYTLTFSANDGDTITVPTTISIKNFSVDSGKVEFKQNLYIAAGEEVHWNAENTTLGTKGTWTEGDKTYTDMLPGTGTLYLNNSTVVADTYEVATFTLIFNPETFQIEQVPIIATVAGNPRRINVSNDCRFIFPVEPSYNFMTVEGDGNMTYDVFTASGHDFEIDTLNTGTTTIIKGKIGFDRKITIYDLSAPNNNGTLKSVLEQKNTVEGESLELIIKDGSFYRGKIQLEGKSTMTIKKDANAAEDASLKILCEEAGAEGIHAESVFLCSGRLDYKGVMSASIEIGEEATFSPGNSVGTAKVNGKNTSTDGVVTLSGNLLLEQDAMGMDLLVADSIVLQGSNAKITLDLTTPVLEDTTYDIITARNGLPWSSEAEFEEDVIINNHGIAYNVSYAIDDATNTVKVTIAFDPNAVPEPSTWALLVLGAAGMLYWRKKNA